MPTLIASLWLLVPPLAWGVSDAVTVTAEVLTGEEFDREQLQQTSDRYRQQINALRAEHGAYHPELSESLLGLGQSLSAVDNHREAADSYRDALHIHRVNNGLHNLDQLPYLELLIQENSLLNNNEELTNNYHYLLWLYKRNYGDNAPAILPVIDRVGRWHLKSYMGGTSQDPAGHLNAAKELYTEAIDIVEVHYGEQDKRLIKPLYQFALSNYYIAADIQERIERQQRFGNSMNNRQYVYARSDRYNDDSPFERILDIYYRGKRALEHILSIHEANPELPTQSRAFALTYLGDWNLLFNATRTAIDNYTRAYAMLDQVQPGAGETVFGIPRRLPIVTPPDEQDLLDYQAEAELEELEKLEKLEDEPAPEDNTAQQQDEETEPDSPTTLVDFLREASQSDGPEVTTETDTTEVVDADGVEAGTDEGPNYAVVSFDILDTGRTRNIRIIDAKPADSVGFNRTARRIVDDTKFRPRFKDGKPVETKDVKIKYIIN